ncbi:MAG: hypothetical protein ACLRIP_11180 [Blautia massiliensis (ex Durand et al. 2017)]
MGANDQVRADAGKTALMKGPLVYCLEEKENGRFLSRDFYRREHFDRRKRLRRKNW